MKWHQRFFWLFLLFLPTQLGFHFWPEWAGVLGRRVDYLAPTVYLTDTLLLLTVTAFVISKLQFPISKQIQRFKIQMLQTKHLWMMVGVVFVVVNIFIATNQMVSVYKWLKVTEFMMLGWYIVRTKPKLSSLSFPLSIGIFYSSILAITQFVLQHSVGGPLWWLGERTFTVDTPGIARIALNWSPASPAGGLGFGHWDFGLKLRPYATFPHPNVLGGFLAVLLPLIVLRYLSILGNLKKKIKYFYGSVLAVGVFALLLTFSRSAIVVGSAAIILMIASRKQHGVSSKGTFAALGIFFLTTFYFLLSTNFSEESVVVRQQLNVAAIKLWQTSPLFGVGLGNFLVRLPEALPSRTIYFLQPAHNIYLLLLSEVGVVGFLFLVWFLQKAFRHSFSIWHVSFGILLVLGLVDHYPLTLQQGQLLLTVLAGMSVLSVH